MKSGYKKALKGYEQPFRASKKNLTETPSHDALQPDKIIKYIFEGACPSFLF